MRRRYLSLALVSVVLLVAAGWAAAQPFDRPFDRLMALSRVEGLTALSNVEGETAADEPDIVILKDGFSWTPQNVDWFHTYVDLWWLAGMVAVATLMLWVAKWIDHDAQRLAVDPVRWNYATMSVCFVSLVAFFVVPPYVSLPAALIAMLVVVWNYIPVRNRRVLPSRRLFTADHRMLLWKRFLRAFGMKPRGLEKKLARVARTHVPVALFFQTGTVASPAEAPPDERDPATPVKELMGQAAKRHAREVYLVPQAGKLAVSFGIDGMVYSGVPLERVRAAALITMLKKLADLASSDPHFRVQLPMMAARFTVAVSVSGEGDAESATLRMSPDGEEMRRFGELGLTSARADALKKAVEGGQGLLVVASPPEMGSRTTTYAMLDALDPYSRNIVTFERPVTGSLASVEQNDLTKSGKPLADILEEKLRQDYDLMMLDGVPDVPTALIALTAAQRGQLVLARLELPDVVGVVEYFLELGVEPQAVARGLHTVVTQRLVRVLCPECRSTVVPSAELLRKLQMDPSQVEHFREESAGCDACGQTGFHGRTGIFEVWQVGEESRRVIAKRAGARELRAAASRDGAVSLRQAGLRNVIQGITSLRELARVLKIGT